MPRYYGPPQPAGDMTQALVSAPLDEPIDLAGFDQAKPKRSRKPAEPKTPLEAAQAELARTMMPHPDEFMEDYSPQAALLFARQVAMSVLRIVTAAASSLADESDDAAPVVDEVLNGVAGMVAGSTHSLVALGVLPAEAETALEVLGEQR